MSEIGHNATDGQLKALVERIENMEEQKRAILEDIKEIYSEAKGAGYDAKIMRRLVRHRAQDEQKSAREDELFDVYLKSLS